MPWINCIAHAIGLLCLLIYATFKTVNQGERVLDLTNFNVITKTREAIIKKWSGAFNTAMGTRRDTVGRDFRGTESLACDSLTLDPHFGASCMQRKVADTRRV